MIYRMGRRLKIFLQCVLCFVVVVFTWHGSKGSILHFSKCVLRPSDIQPFIRRLALESVLGSSAVRVDTRSQDFNIPPLYSPSFLRNSKVEVMPSPLAVAQGFALRSPIESPTSSRDVNPTINEAVPAVVPVAPPQHATPSAKSEASGRDLSPSSMISPSSESRKEIPGADASGKAPDKSPTASMQPADPPAHSPPQATQPNINSTQHGPVAAPPIETSTPSSPMNSKGFIPARSPVPSRNRKPWKGNNTTPPPTSNSQPPDTADPPTSIPRAPVIYHSPAPSETKKPPKKTASTPSSNQIPGEGISDAPAPAEANIPATHAPAPLTLHSPAPDKAVKPPIEVSPPTSQSQPPETATPPTSSARPPIFHSPAPDKAVKPPIEVSPPTSQSQPPETATPPTSSARPPIFHSPAPDKAVKPPIEVSPPTSQSQPPETATPPTSSARPPIFHSPAPDKAVKPPIEVSPPTSQSQPPETAAPPTSSARPPIFHSPAPDKAVKPPVEVSPPTSQSQPPETAAPPTSSARPPIFHSPAPSESTKPRKTAFPPRSYQAPGEGISEAPAPVEANISTTHAPAPLTLHSPPPVKPPKQVSPPISQSQPPDQARPPSISQASHSPAPVESRRHNKTASSPTSHSESPQTSVSDPPVPPPIISTPDHKSPSTRISPISPPSISPRTSNAAAPIAPTQNQRNQRRMRNHTSAATSPAPSLAHDPGMELAPAPIHHSKAPKNNSQRHAFPPHVQGPPLAPTEGPLSPGPSQVIPPRPHEWSHPPLLSPSAPAPLQPNNRPQPKPRNLGPVHSPVHPPSGSLSRNAGTPRPQPIQALPPPPPNLDCSSLVCTAPLTNPPPAAPCACVQPMKVGLLLGIELYTFFPLVSELAQEVASGVVMEQSQVRIMGANAASEDPEKTIALLDLVPLRYRFDNTTAFMAYEKFWNKQVTIKSSYFGDYKVLYVIYPGLPPSPPTAPADFSGDGAFNNGNNGRTIKPLGVDVGRMKKEKLNGSLIAIIVLSSFVTLVLIVGALWLLLLRNRGQTHSQSRSPQSLLPSLAKSSATGPTTLGSHSSASASFSSSIATYALKTFSLSDIEMATNRFNNSRVIGEGGFGRVYEGTLEDGTSIAVKVLKRDDQQGGREFLSEVEMLSRLHHRNLVKLIGICTEEIRCLVYELIPNGSVESHLHGIDKETAPLDWNNRMKIALGAARGLAYLHEDSSPRVIHRDFKSSNILLEYDYTPKVSDFGLARTALEEGNEHISTRVMGTFGYVAPEYAMTGHLLVKSDVYSYGVVLLELLTGRKPVDMLQPSGQENLVNWARPLLTSKEGLQSIIDPALGTDCPLGDVAKVAAIASMCVQAEVSQRPFMGEVVQALKLVCSEGSESKGSGSCGQDYSSAQETTDIRTSAGYGLESENILSASDVFSTSTRFPREASSSFRRFSSSGPLTTSTAQQNWQRTRGLSAGSTSGHDLVLKLGSGLDGNDEWS